MIYLKSLRIWSVELIEGLRCLITLRRWGKGRPRKPIKMRKEIRMYSQYKYAKMLTEQRKENW